MKKNWNFMKNMIITFAPTKKWWKYDVSLVKKVETSPNLLIFKKYTCEMKMKFKFHEKQSEKYMSIFKIESAWGGGGWVY